MKIETIIEYFSNHTFFDLLLALLIVIGIIFFIEKFIKWLWDMFIKLYNKKRGREEEVSTIDKNTAAIEDLSKNIEELGNLVNRQYTHLDKKIDEQKDRLTRLDEDGKRRDCAVLRDRILGGMRYFSQNVDENGIIHISMTDYENMNEMFSEYFNCNGNGVCHSLYENEFKKFKIDTDRKY